MSSGAPRRPNAKVKEEEQEEEEFGLGGCPQSCCKKLQKLKPSPQHWSQQRLGIMPMDVDDCSGMFGADAEKYPFGLFQGGPSWKMWNG